jgi:two-component system, OmpR family, heavy metal sensor histidine kinase CusS
MSLKNSGPLSLSLRLTLWYAASTFLLLLVGSGFLYLQLVKAYETRDERFIVTKAATLRELVRQQDLRTLNWEIDGSYSDGQARSHTEPVFARVIAPDGKLVMETAGMSERMPVRIFPASEHLEDRIDERHIFQVLSMQTPEGYRLQVARDVTFERDLLASYRERLSTVLGIGLLLSGIAGFMIARHGIRPVEEISTTLRHIGSSTLGERVETAGLPTELYSLASTFNETLDRLEDAFGRLARFSSDIAHELRTPINNMRGEAEVALSKARSTEDYRDVLESSLEEYVRLSTMIDRLLFLARSEHPETQIRREVIDVGTELTTVREFYQAAASEVGVNLDLSSPVALTASVDRTLLQRALSNLIENSLRHTSTGGHISLEAGRNNGSVVISVVDDGCGIPPEHLSRVFDRFHRVDAARSQNNGGAGLGLAIVKSVATLHGGEAGIESTLGQGTRVSLRFPAA